MPSPAAEPSTSPPSDNAAQVPLSPPRFSLRTLFLVVTGVCLLLGLAHWVSPVTMVVVLFILFAIGAHVLGNALGTRLRDGPATNARQAAHAAPLPQATCAPTTHLSTRRPLGGTMAFSAVVGLLLGMGCGALLMRELYGDHLDALPLGITLVAFGVLGSVAGFLLGTFARVMYLAWWQSHSSE